MTAKSVTGSTDMQLAYTHTIGPSARGVNLLLWVLVLVIITYLWLEEILDIPHMFGFQSTPINWLESLAETIVILIAAIVIAWLNNRLLRRIAYLEGFHTICAHCKRIRVDAQWLTVEQYMQQHSSLRLSHSICPKCAKQYFGYDVADDKKGESHG